MTRPRDLFFAFLVLCLVGVHAHAAALEAGAARTDITPPVGGPLWGFFDRKNNPSIGVRDPLQARPLVLAAGADRIALVSSTQMYFPTIEAVAQGGCGTEGYSAPADFGAGEQMMDRALVHLYQMRGRIK